jgi:hypothetical protein
MRTKISRPWKMINRSEEEWKEKGNEEEEYIEDRPALGL